MRIILQILLSVSFISSALIALGSQDVTFASVTYKEVTSGQFVVIYTIVTTGHDSVIPPADLESNLVAPDSAYVTALYPIFESRQKVTDCRDTVTRWIHTFYADADLSNPRFKGTINCCYLRFDLKILHVAVPMITNQEATSSYFVYADRFVCDDRRPLSGLFPDPAGSLFDHCRNYPSYVSFYPQNLLGLVDSVSALIVAPRKDHYSSINYLTGYSSNHPIDCYQNKYVRDLDHFNLEFTPADRDQAVALGVYHMQYVQKADGSYVEAGRHLSLISIRTSDCGNNAPPEIISKLDFRVCEEKPLCFVVNSADVTIKPPPPASSTDDTVSLRWNRGIPEATFTILNPDTIHQNARFCWKPKEGQSSLLPYSFVVTARDDHCPGNGVTHRAFTIRVDQKLKAERRIERLLNGLIRVDLIPDTTFTSDHQVLWELMDSSGKLLFDQTTAHFTSSGVYGSSEQNDFIKYTKPGTYIIHSVISSDHIDCPVEYYDTLDFYSLSVVNPNAHSIRLYPNPTDRLVRIETDGHVPDDVDLRLTDLRGKTIYQTRANLPFIMDLQSLQPGVYRLQSEGAVHFSAPLIIAR